jgi:hypothetical protein
VTRRGAVLAIVGAIYIVVGLSQAFLPVPSATADGYGFAERLAPLPFWGGVWAVVGLIGCITSFFPKGRDAWGYATLVVFSLAWASMAALSTILYGADRGWILAAIWGAFAGVLMIVSGMESVTRKEPE